VTLEIRSKPSLESGLGVPLPLLLVAGAAVTGATLQAWINNGWSTAEYNAIVKTIDASLHNWDAAGWTNDCWKKNPVKRAQWLALWKVFSDHYKQYGQQSVYLADAAENPIRNYVLPQMIEWSTWLKKTCNVDTGGLPEAEEPKKPFDFENALKWGAIGIGAIVALQLVASVRSALPPRDYY
jgi:hypothetical protein